MNTATAQDLKEYLGMVLDMEQNVYTLERASGELERDLANLNASKRQVPEYASRIMKPEEPKPSAAGAALIIGIVLSVLPGITPLLGIPLVIYAIVKFITNNSDQKNYQQRIAKYEIDVAEEKKKHEKTCNEIRKNNKSIAAQIAVTSAEKNRVDAMLQEATEQLQAAYAVEIICSKYRNLPAVGTMYEYFCFKRCKTLDGRDGAYNMLETESRLDAINLKLDTINDNLDDIKRNQYTVYKAIKEGNQRSAMILESVGDMKTQLTQANANSKEIGEGIKELQKSSELTAYNTEQTKKQLEYMNRMNYYSGKYKDAGFREAFPPQS